MPRSSRRIFVLLLLAPITLGCASWKRGFEDPEVTLVGLRPLSGEDFEQRFEISVRILNPNDEPIEGDGLDVTLDLNGRRLARAVSGESFAIPRLSDEVIVLVGTTHVLDLFRQAVALPNANRFEYAIRGRLFLDNSPGWLRFSRKGSLLPEELGP